MRVVAGRFGGRPLKGPAHRGLRPTSDRVREAVFNILGPKTLNARVLDLFAGTGGLGIEAISRGASRVVFVEVDRRALVLLRENLSSLGLQDDRVAVIPGDVPTVLRRMNGEGHRFDLVLADPPYAAGLARETLAFLAQSHLLAPGGLIVVEHRAADGIDAPAGLAPIERRIYGETAVSFLALTEVR